MDIYAFIKEIMLEEDLFGSNRGEKCDQDVL